MDNQPQQPQTSQSNSGSLFPPNSEQPTIQPQSAPQPTYQPQTTVYPEGAQPQPTVYGPQQYQQPQPQVGGVVMGGQPTSPYAQAAASPEGSKSFLVAFLLSMFLGVLGIDRFYLGKIGTGILKLLTIGGLGIWATIDFILIFSNHMKAKDGTLLNGYKKHLKTALIVFVAWAMVCVAFGVYDILVLNKAVHTVSKCSNGCSFSFNSSSNTPQATSATTDTPLGQTSTGNGDAKGWSVKIAVNQSPQTTGDTPNTGMHYVEVDFTIANNSGQSGIVPGTFYYKTSSGKLDNDTGTDGNGPNIDAKNVQLTNTNLQALVADSVNNGQTDNTHYLLYQVPDGDNGKLIWYDGIYQTDTKLAIFDLN
jgi:hypothetical protein